MIYVRPGHHWYHSLIGTPLLLLAPFAWYSFSEFIIDLPRRIIEMAITVGTRTFSIGWIIALLVLIICVILAVIGQPATPLVVLGLIGGLALAILLG